MIARGVVLLSMLFLLGTPSFASTNSIDYLKELDRQYATTYESTYTQDEISATYFGNGLYNYKYDCSGVFDMALKNVLINVYIHFSDVVGSTGSRLTTQEVSGFFAQMGANDLYWQLVANPYNAQPGDVIVWIRDDGSGHLVTDKQNLGYKTGSKNSEVLLAVYDSALSRHSTDSTRYHNTTVPRKDTGGAGRTGFGFGVISVKVNLTQYRWRGTEADSPLQSVVSMYIGRLR